MGDKNVLFQNFVEKLPNVKLINVKNEIDYYGVKNYIYNKCNKQVKGRSFVSWRHGWYYYKNVIDFKLINSSNQYCLRHLVHNERMLKYFQDCNLKNLELVGMPYLYIDDEDIPTKKIPNSLLVMPTHSTRFTADKKKILDSRFLEKVYEISKNFAITVVVLYSIDYKKVIADNKLFNDRLFFIEGANILDANSLLRLRYIFNSFENMITDSIGTHVLYASYSNCKVSMDKDHYKGKDADTLKKNDPFFSAYPKILDFVVEQNKVSYLKSEYPFLFKGIYEATINKDWADEEIGEKHRRQHEGIWELLEHSTSEKLKGYILTLYELLRSSEKTKILKSKINYLRNKMTQ